MKYSVLMSVYYKEKAEWLNQAIESILKQTIFPDEIVIVKDGKLTEELDNIINLYVEQYSEVFNIVSLKENQGLGLALNEGILRCKNELIIRMDSDDYSVPDRCEKLINFFEKNSEYDCVGSFETEFEDNIENIISIHKVPEKSEEIRQFMRRRCAILHPTVAYKKSSVIRAGNYRDIKLYEDYDLFIRMSIEHNMKVYNIQESLYYIRVNKDFYRRRGGFEYMMTVIKFKNKQRKKGYISFIDFLISAGGQAIVCLLPNWIREWFYIKFLR